MRSIGWRGGRMAAGSRSGANARRRASSRATRAPRYRRGRHSRTTPTFRHSPRSTRGTTRTIAYWKALRGGSGTIRLLDEGSGRLESLGHVADIRGALGIGVADGGIVGQPHVWECADQRRQEGLVDQAGIPRVGRFDRPGIRQQDVIADALERPPRMRLGVAPGVVDVQRCAVVDEPWTAVPDEQVGVLRRPIGVRDETIEPDDVGSELRVDDVASRRRGWIERQRTRQEIHPEVRTRTRPDQIVDLLIGLCVTERRVDLDRDEVRHGESHGPPDLAAQPLRDERSRSLARTAELDDVQPVIVRLDEAWQRPALTERHDVAGRDDGPDHRQSVAEWSPSADATSSTPSPRPCSLAHVGRMALPRRDYA